MSRRINWTRFIEGWFNFDVLYREVVEKAPPQGAHFVELGVWKGQSTAYMCEQIYASEKEIRFDGIDWFYGSPEHTSRLAPGSYPPEIEILSSEQRQKWLYEHTIANLQPALDLNLVNIINSSVKEAAKLYQDNSLDFVFHDASHLFADLLVELPLWYPKVKPGGVLAGHDYSNEMFDGQVAKAVNRFAIDNKVDVLFRSREDSWMIIKPF